MKETKKQWATLAGIIIQLLALAWIVYEFEIEDGLGFSMILHYVGLSFLAQLFAPLKWRPAILVITTLAAIIGIFGLQDGAILISVALLFFSLAHLPFSRFVKYLAMGVALLILVYFRMNWHLYAGYAPNIWKIFPVVGSIFMFRMMLYLYEQPHTKVSLDIWQRLAYFFMLPNLVLTLFPVIDYKTYYRSYFNKPETEIYQKGIRYLARGVFHILIYRLIYHYMLIQVDHVNDIFDMLRYMVTNYGLIIRLSGVFYLSIGIMGLFGFDLPEIFSNYFLSNGFGDLWRRINTYWRDFIMKVFYYPIYQKIKKIGKLTAVVVTVLFAFIITWFLHSWQWFWLMGTFPIRETDAVFWMTFGVLVAANAGFRYNQKARPKKEEGWKFKDSAINVLQIMGMFMFMSILWSLWTFSTLKEWYDMLFLASGTGIDQLGILALGFLIVLMIGMLIHFIIKRFPKLLILDSYQYKVNLYSSILLIVVIGIMGFTKVRLTLENYTDGASTWMYTDRLNRQDAFEKVNGYYQEILVPGGMIPNAWKDTETPPDWKGLWNANGMYETDTLPFMAIKPNLDMIVNRASFSSNKWGMRDDEITKDKPANTYRIAIIGGSYPMGLSVGDDEVFDRPLEQLLDDYDSQDSIDYQVLNFAVQGYDVSDMLAQLEKSVIDFEPDMVILFNHGIELVRLSRKIKKYVENDVKIKYPFMQEIISKSGVDKNLTVHDFDKMFYPYAEDFTSECYEYFSRVCSKNDINPVWAYWPMTRYSTIRNKMDKEEKKYFNMADKAGFEILDLSKVFEGESQESIAVAPWDGHPNAYGHQLMAEFLFEELLSKADTLAIPLRREKE